MSSNLENMKVLAAVEVRTILDNIITLSPLRLIMEVQYDILSNDGSVLYREKFSADMSNVPNIGTKTLQERYNWALSEAKKDAEAKYGN